MQRGKRYRDSAAQVDRTTSYPPLEGIRLAKSLSRTRFDETVELHLRTGLNPRNADQQLRGVVVLPHGLGKKVRILVFAQGEAAATARAAGAEHAGGDDLIKKIEEGWLEFDVALSTPDMMGKVGRLGRILGRKGLMPNPKSGTVIPAADLGRAIQEARRGRVEFKLDRTAIVHAVLGKASFEEQQLLDNLTTFVDAIVKARPSGSKGQYIKSAVLCTTMGPGVKLDLGSTLTLSAA